jgi:hypothetical protein
VSALSLPTLFATFDFDIGLVFFFNVAVFVFIFCPQIRRPFLLPFSLQLSFSDFLRFQSLFAWRRGCFCVCRSLSSLSTLLSAHSSLFLSFGACDTTNLAVESSLPATCHRGSRLAGDDRCLATDSIMSSRGRSRGGACSARKCGRLFQFFSFRLIFPAFVYSASQPIPPLSASEA